jgi:hypothetical protein
MLSVKTNKESKKRKTREIGLVFELQDFKLYPFALRLYLLECNFSVGVDITEVMKITQMRYIIISFQKKYV